MDSLPNFLTHGAPLRARFARARAPLLYCKYTIQPRGCKLFTNKLSIYLSIYLVSDYFLCSIRGQLLFCCFLIFLHKVVYLQETSQLSPTPSLSVTCRRAFFEKSFQFFSEPRKFTLPVSFKKFNKFTNSKGRKNFSWMYLTRMPRRHKQQRKRFHMNKPRSTLVFTNFPRDQCSFWFL